MERIEITTGFTKDGKMVPLDFIFKEQEIQVINIGRSWETDEGRHILVMDQYNETYHLFFQRSDLCWYIIKDIKPSPRLI
jgi:hypothetical protein